GHGGRGRGAVRRDGVHHPHPGPVHSHRRGGGDVAVHPPLPAGTHGTPRQRPDGRAGQATSRSAWTDSSASDRLISSRYAGLVMITAAGRTAARLAGGSTRWPAPGRNRPHLRGLTSTTAASRRLGSAA